jgi:nucleoside-diphosphate-sugar epimerase
VRQIAETVKKIIGDVEIEFIEGRTGDFRGKEGLSVRAKEELGWEPQVSFEDGVRRYIDWFKARELARGDAQAELNARIGIEKPA